MDSFEAQYHSLFRRCVQGCGTEVPSCNCKPDESCTSVVATCDQCASTSCVPKASVTTRIGNKDTSSSPNAGAIAGGVIAGVLTVAAVTYLVWRFCIKPKRQQYEQEDWVEESNDESLPAEKDFTMQRDARASTHTVASLASTVLTRASNIIQIAYIPGVTNRSAPSTPGLLVPPVPPIPIALSSAASTPRYEQEHFFMPGDLRDSTYSAMSDRTSYARNSVASTIYGKNAVVSPLPAQTVIRGKAAVVSVTTKGASSAGELTPPVPSLNYGKYGISGPPSPAFSVGSTFLSNATAATQVKPQMVKMTSSPKRGLDASSSEASSQYSSLPRDSTATTIIDDSPTIDQGPFDDPPHPRQESSSSLSAIIEEATKRAQSDKTSKGSKITPFGDENEVKE